MAQNTELLKKQKLSDVEAIAANGDTSVLDLFVKGKNLTAEETIEILRTLLDNCLDVHSKKQREETALHSAIKARARDVIDFLLEHKVSLDNTAALFFIRNEYEKLLELKNQSDDEMRKQEKESVSFLEWLIVRGLDIDRPNLCGQSALFLAMDYHLLHLLPVLLKTTKNIDYVEYSSRCTLLHIILKNETSNCWSSSYSCQYASNVVNTLLDRGVSAESVDSSWNLALHLAIAVYSDMNVQILMDHTINVDRKNDAGETPFLIAISGWLNCVKPDIDDFRKVFQRLIREGADLNVGNKSGFQALHIFAEETSSLTDLDEEEIELFEMLIKIGCNVNAKNLRGQTPLHIAAAGSNVAVVQKLIENGARINPRDDNGATPLYLACIMRDADLKMTEILVEHGANVNAKNGKGFTPLHESAGTKELCLNNVPRMKLLLEHGADFSALSDIGHSVLHMSIARYDRLHLLDPEYNDKGPSLNEILTSDFFDGSIYPSEDLEFLLNHWIKLYAAELECSVGKNFDASEIGNGPIYYPESREIYINCRKEIEILKNTFIDNDRTSIYAFLHMKLYSRRAHLHNEKLQELVHTPSQLEKQFPHYAILILSSYNEVIERKSLMELAKTAWIKLTKINTGDLCIEHIFSFLSNGELYDLIEASAF